MQGRLPKFRCSPSGFGIASDTRGGIIQGLRVAASQERQTGRRAWTAAAAAAVLLLALLIALVVINLQTRRERGEAAAWQNHTLDVLLQVERLSSRLSELQRGQRGYLLTDNLAYLEPYRQQSEAVPGLLDGLRRLTVDDAGQQARIARLSILVAQLQSQLEATVQLELQSDRAGAMALVQTGQGERTMNAARAELMRIVVTETELFAVRDARWRALVARSAVLNNLLYAAALLVGVAVVVLIRGAAITAAKAREAVLAADALARSRASLEVEVAERTGELATANAGLRAQIDRAQQAEAQVRQLQKLEAIGQLTGGIAHDFNNMLAITLGSLEMAQRRLGDGIDSKVAKLIDNAIEGAKRAAGLTARLLAFSRQQPLVPEPVDANKFVGGMSELLRRTIGENVEIETVLSGGLWRTYADAAQLESAIVNLAVNARDAMPGGGKVTIETANSHLDDAYAANHADVVPGQYVAICVTDTGTGMPPEVIERAFDPFYTTKGVGKGSGLGLSQVFGFVKQSGGHIKIYSEPDHGTTVKIYLPRWLGAEPQDMVSAGETVLPRAVPGEVVMVVEDEEFVRRMSIEALTELGYAVVEAKDGETALQLLGGQPHLDLLFTDIVMPGMNGRILVDHAQALRPGLKVLYTTGYTRNAVVHNGMLDAEVAFLTKPFTLQQLALKVRQVLDGGGINRRV